MYSSNGTASGLAKRALSMMGEEVPKRILPCVPNWKTCEVQTWLQQVGFSAFCSRFQVSSTTFIWMNLFHGMPLTVITLQELQVDGDLLLNITEQDLSTDLGMTAGLTRKRSVLRFPQEPLAERRDPCVLSTQPAGF